MGFFLSFDLPLYAAGGPDNGRNDVYGGMMDYSSTKEIGFQYTLYYIMYNGMYTYIPH